MGRRAVSLAAQAEDKTPSVKTEVGQSKTRGKPPASRAEPLPPAIQRSLREVFGVERLREGQEDVIRRVLAGVDTLALMPAGTGKSLCYQLPALHLDGLTLIVSPLIALMKDQAERLAEAGVAVDQLNSAVPAREQAATLERIASGRSAVLFVTPERLAEPEFLDTLRPHRVALFVIDEAHCISQWGHDFRPAYLEIAPALEALQDPPVLALTATAPPDVVADIRQQLGRPDLAIVDTGLYRPNLRLQVVACVNDDDKQTRLAEALERNTGSGIVYTATVKECVAVHAALQARGEPATLYHGRLPRAERAANQERFMAGDARIMVATNAFGMGIDKRDLRFVLHYQMPGSPEAYYQEAGRAGRDGDVAHAALLYDRRDRRVQQFFLARRYPTVDDVQRVHRALLERTQAMSVDELAAALAPMARGHLAVTLQALRVAGLARADRHRAWRAERADPQGRVYADVATAYEERAERDHEALERMVFYAQTGFCRWRVLLEHFEQATSFTDFRCGHCDNCLRPPEPVEPPVARTVAASAAPRWKPGSQVIVPRYGRGEVLGATADEAEVRFPDGSVKRFVARYVRDAWDAAPAQDAANAATAQDAANAAPP